MNGLDVVPVPKRRVGAEDFKFSLGVTKIDRIRSEFIRGTGQVERFEGKVRGRKC